MVGAIISAATGLASGIAGGIASAKARKKQRKELQRQSALARRDYDKDYYQGINHRSDIQYLLNQQREDMRENVNKARGRAVVTGATSNAEAAAQNAATKSMAETMGRIASMSQSQKNAATRNYANARNRIFNNQYQYDALSAQQGANMLQSGINMIGKAARAFAQSNNSDDNKEDNTSTKSGQENIY